MIHCKELNESFNDKESLFKALKNNKDLIIAEKKAAIYKSCEKGQSTNVKALDLSKLNSINKEIKLDPKYRYFVVNSSRILDSHKDMHFDGNWEKTTKEQQGKVYLVFDHTLKRSEIIALKEDIEMFTLEIPFSLLGKDYEGDTYCLIYKVKKDRIINKDAKEWLDNGYSFEASVRMQYVNILPCFNSDRLDDVKEKENYDKYYPYIANKEDHGEIDYFWVVLEAKNVKESSLVLFGSNPATGIIEPSKDTQNENKEAANSTSNLINFYKSLNF
jgi:hypothetical protein